MKTFILLGLTLLATLYEAGQRNSFTIPTTGSAVNDTLGVLSSNDGVAMQIYLRRGGTCAPTSKSFSFTSHVSTGVVHVQSNYSLNCKNSVDIKTFDFTKGSARPKGLQFNLWDV